MLFPGRAVATIMNELPSMARLLERGDVLRDLHVVHQPLVQPRILSACQHRRCEIERGVARRVHPRRQPAEMQPRELHLVGDASAASRR